MGLGASRPATGVGAVQTDEKGTGTDAKEDKDGGRSALTTPLLPGPSKDEKKRAVKAELKSLWSFGTRSLLVVFIYAFF